MTSMSLPSIHEMFPDHLLKGDLRPPRPTSGSPDYRTPARSPIPSVCERLTRFHIKPPYGVDGSRNHAHSPHPQDPAYRTRRLSSPDSSLPHLSNRSYPCNTNGGNSLEPDFEDDDCPIGRSMPSIDGALLGNNMPVDTLGRRHVCTTCFKRFNRPSSLRIHRNTHTGATPFKCPFGNCGREFNVNSNMRRHYRNHFGASRGQGHFPPTHGTNELRSLAPATTHSIPAHQTYSEGSHPVTNDHSQSRNRQRRLEEDREIPVPIVGRDVEPHNTPRTHQPQHYGVNYSEGSYGKYAPMPSPPTSHSSSSDEGLDMGMDEETSRFRSRRSVIHDKINKRPIGGLEGQYARLHATSSQGSVSPSLSQASSIASRRSSPTGTERHPSEHSQKPKYSASKPYSASFGDARVRTTLRPVFM